MYLTAFILSGNISNYRRFIKTSGTT